MPSPSDELEAIIDSLPTPHGLERLVVTYPQSCYQKRLWVPWFVWRLVAKRINVPPQMYLMQAPPFYHFMGGSHVKEF